MADETEQRAGHAAPQASLRAELLVQLLGAQAALAEQIDALRAGDDHGLIAGAEAQLAELAAVQQRLASGTVSVAMLRAEVATTVAAATSLTTQARGAAVQAQHHAADALRQASSAARATVAAFLDDVYERKVFDPYLRFASAGEEAAYRQREEERRRAIEQANEEGTPQGDLAALRLSREQMSDAGRFGAADSPDWARIDKNLGEREAELAAAMATGRGDATVPSAPSTESDASEPAPASKDVPPELLAAMRSLGVTVPSQETSGHGVPREVAKTSRAPTLT